MTIKDFKSGDTYGYYIDDKLAYYFSILVSKNTIYTTRIYDIDTGDVAESLKSFIKNVEDGTYRKTTIM